MNLYINEFNFLLIFLKVYKYYLNLNKYFTIDKINCKLQIAKPSNDCVQSYHVGLNKGYTVTKHKRPVRPASRKGRTSDRVREIRKIV